MKTLKILPVITFIGALMTLNPGLYAQDADDAAADDGAAVATPLGGAYRHGMRDVGFRGFTDEDGNGLNDYLEDSDGDGVVNAHDPDSDLYRGEPGTALGRGLGFVDEDGNGLNDYLEDSDGDGVINAHDSDSPLYRDPRARGAFGRGLSFVDEDGNGINDRLEDSDGDGVINAHDPDSPLYRDPSARGVFGRRLRFIDENGDGVSDCLEDSDGDGVINSLDPDSPLYRGSAAGNTVRGARLGSAGKTVMQRGSAFSGQSRSTGRARVRTPGSCTTAPAGSGSN
ncbi:MAG: hypothetical protein JXQ83_06765 [Candidatus Glassbacteria bacterium]|nr:hypothetical protein [Candidatus Glassbacteria bacterium]